MISMHFLYIYFKLIPTNSFFMISNRGREGKSGIDRCPDSACVMQCDAAMQSQCINTHFSGFFFRKQKEKLMAIENLSRDSNGG